MSSNDSNSPMRDTPDYDAAVAELGDPAAVSTALHDALDAGPPRFASSLAATEEGSRNDEQPES